MSSIPLPALGIHQQESPLDQYARALQIRNMQQQGQLLPGQLQMQQQQIQASQQENQMRQQQLSDQQAMTKAMQEWDGKDFSQLPGLVMKHGASAQTVLGLRSSIVKQQTDLAQLSKEQLANEKTKNDFFAQELENVKSFPEEQRPQAFQSALQRSVQKGYLDPQQAQGMQYQGPDQLDMLEKSFLGFSGTLKQTEAQIDMRAKKAQAAKNEMEVEQGGPLTDQSRWVANYLKSQNLTPTPANTLAAQNEYIKKTKLEPAQLRANVFLQRPTEVLDPENPGQTIMVPAKESFGMAGKSSVSQKALSTQAAKAQPQFVAFDIADQHLQLVEQAGKALQNGNVQVLNQIANAYGVAVGKDPVTTFKALTTVAAPEIVRASAGSGQMSEREIEVARNNFDPKLSPAQITANVAAMRGLMAGKKNALQKNLQGLKQGDVTGGAGQQQAAPNGNEIHYKVVNGELVPVR